LRALLALFALGCGDYPPFEPGTDLPEQAAEVPEGVALAGSDVTGAFTMAGVVTAAGMAIEVGFTAELTQRGAIGGGEATLMIELVDGDDAEAQHPRFPEPVPVDSTGAFVGTVVDLVVSHETANLLTADASADVEFDGVVLTNDCVHGLLGLQLKDARTTIAEQPLSVRLEGTFNAIREGSECSFE